MHSRALIQGAYFGRLFWALILGAYFGRLFWPDAYKPPGRLLYHQVIEQVISARMTSQVGFQGPNRECSSMMNHI